MTAGSPPPSSPTVAPDDEDRYHVGASSAADAGEVHVLKHDDTFAVLGRAGDISGASGGKEGLYAGGTRFLSLLRLRVQGQRPLVLSSGVLADNILFCVDLTNPDLHDEEQRLVVPHGTIHLARSKFVRGNTYFERLIFANYHQSAIQVDVSLELACDFRDVFEVRGTTRAARGELLSPAVEGDRVTHAYRGLDGVVRRTHIELAPAPARLDARRATWSLQLGGRQKHHIDLRIECDVASSPPAARRESGGYDVALGRRQGGVARAHADQCQIVTSNDDFNDWLRRSEADLRMLITTTPDGPYPYAGVPWFSTPFGRDAIWTALEVLWVRPEVAGGVLRFLSRHQAQTVDADADAEPGKIIHEMRSGEMAALREIPFGRYYGSIDSTPLYLMLAAGYHRATGDRALIESVWPNLMAALSWMETFGDPDADGFIEYGRRSKDGLVQQGWKDSNDSVFHQDGALAQGPIALCEVQGYAYAAVHGMAALARALGHDAVAARCEQVAAALRARFDAAFFCEDIGTYALALDMQKRPCRVRASNAGHCLYTGIASPARAASVRRVLMSDEMFSGWGIRTLACNEHRYNPMSYHNGSIWPHDNAIIAAGLAAYGHKDAAAQVLGALFEATMGMRLKRLPELFCGFPRDAGQEPTRYPVACSPQAWAAGAVFMLLAAVLGLEVDALNGRMVFRNPFLPRFLERVEIRGLHVGEARLDVRLQRHDDDVGVTVMGKRGAVEVVSIK